jgi:hypothetical protein
LGFEKLPPLFVVGSGLKEGSMSRYNIEVKSFATYSNYDTSGVAIQNRHMLSFHKYFVALHISGKRACLRNSYFDSMRARLTSSYAPKVSVHILDATIGLPIFLNTNYSTFAGHKPGIQVNLITFVLESLYVVLDYFDGQ